MIYQCVDEALCLPAFLVPPSVNIGPARVTNKSGAYKQILKNTIYYYKSLYTNIPQCIIITSIST